MSGFDYLVTLNYWNMSAFYAMIIGFIFSTLHNLQMR